MGVPSLPRRVWCCCPLHWSIAGALILAGMSDAVGVPGWCGVGIWLSRCIGHLRNWLEHTIMPGIMSSIPIMPVIGFAQEQWRMSIFNLATLGEILREKREDAEPALSQTSIAIELGRANIKPRTQPQLSKLESGLVTLRESWPDPDHRLAVLQAYGFTPAEMARLNDKFDLGIGHLLTRGELRHGPTADELDWLEFQVYEAASAGTGDGHPVDDDEGPIKLPRDFLRQKSANPQNTMIVKVNGDCMVSHEVRFGRKSLAHGDFAIVEIGRPPTPGDRQVFWDEQERQLIIKYLGEGENNNTVTLYDERGAQYHRPADDPELIYRGVVLGRFGMY